MPVWRMAVLPALIGAAFCALLFLAWWAFREPKDGARYAAELRASLRNGDARARWRIARELSENLADRRLYHPDLLAALLEIVATPALDEDEIPTPAGLDDPADPTDPAASADPAPLLPESVAVPRLTLRGWAAELTGRVAGVLRDARAAAPLCAVLEETPPQKGAIPADPAPAAGLRYHAANGLGLLKNLDSAKVLMRRLACDPNACVRAACVKALGAIGESHFFPPTPRPTATAKLKSAPPAAETAPTPPTAKSPNLSEEFLIKMRAMLRNAYTKTTDQGVRWNAAVALARLRDATGRATLEELAGHPDPLIRENAHHALERLPQE